MDSHKLTCSERSFLRQHGIATSDVLDARGLTKAEWRDASKRQASALILGSECRQAGHRLRTRAGHCVECDPSKIAYQRRHRQAGFVYIAGSQAGVLIKIGGASSVAARQEKLRQSQYARLDDWRMLRHVAAPEYGLLEKNVQARLAQFAVPVPYTKDSERQLAKEVFRCSFSRASNALDAALDDLGWASDRSHVEACSKYYEFDAPR